MPETKKILIIDDDEKIRETVGMMIKCIYPSYEVKDASNGEEGEQAIDEYNPDLVITDLNMPVKKGTYVIIKAKEKDTPVVLMTDSSLLKKQECEGSIDYIVDCMGAIGLVPDYILNKPFDGSDLQKAIETAFHASTNLEGNLQN